MELVTNADAAADFANGIVPKGLEQDMVKVQQKQEGPKAVPDEIPPPGNRRVISPAEAREMSSEELSRLLASGEAILGNSSEG